MYRNLSLEASNTVNALSSAGQVGPSEHLRPRTADRRFNWSR
jgi:hypothetical protein